MRIEKFNAAGLREFLDSEQYRDMPLVPVSEHRAESWLNNPRLKPDDIILYIGFEENNMIAYRGILPDRHRDIRFGWFSGNWVRPDLRRRGLASKLFEEAWKDWGHQLMYTNYAPESKAVYDKSSRFELYNERPGIRYYQRSSSAVLLGNRSTMYKRSRPLLKLADGVINTVQDLRILIKKDHIKDLIFEESDKPDLEAIDFLEKSQAGGFSIRSHEDFDWITSYPWVLQTHEMDDRYFFSSVSPRFRNICVKIRNAQNDMRGFIWLVQNGEKMSIPYVTLGKEAEPAASRIINYYMQTGRISYMTTYQSTLIEFFKPGPMLGTRNMIQNYFCTRDLIKQLPDLKSVQFQDGDGDVVFV
ncbi:MAG TPA: N-acetyltransferase [Bacteroides sp.]|nr:N-acetyltransferase [Bacteroides sp.]